MTAAADRPDVAGQLARPARDRLAEDVPHTSHWCAAPASPCVCRAHRLRVADALLAPDGAVTELIAEAVAKALAPVLALADELGAWPSPWIMSPHVFADRIRAAAAPEEGR